MTEQCWLLGGAVLVVSLLVFAFLTAVPAPVAYPAAFALAASASWTLFCLDKRRQRRR